MRSLGKFSRTQSVCVSALPSHSILPVIIYFPQMSNYLYTLPVAHSRTPVVPPSPGRSLLVDCGLRNWVWYVFRVIIAKKVLLNRYKRGTYRRQFVEHRDMKWWIGRGDWEWHNIGKVRWFLERRFFSSPDCIPALVSIPSSVSFSTPLLPTPPLLYYSRT